MNVTIAKITAALILIIMASTWAAISIKLLEMQPVSNSFLSLAGALGTVIFGDGITGVLQKYNFRAQK